jgi:hypothetical protein
MVKRAVVILCLFSIVHASSLLSYLFPSQEVIKEGQEDLALIENKSHEDDCFLQVYKEMKLKCREFNHDHNMVMASKITICHLKKSYGDVPYFCNDKMSSKECTQQFDSETFGIYTQHLISIQKVCMFLESTTIVRNMEKTVSELKEAADNGKLSLKEVQSSLSSYHNDLKEAQSVLEAEFGNIKHMIVEEMIKTNQNMQQIHRSQVEIKSDTKNIKDGVDVIWTKIVDFAKYTTNQLYEITNQQEDIKTRTLESLNLQKEIQDTARTLSDQQHTLLRQQKDISENQKLLGENIETYSSNLISKANQTLSLLDEMYGYMHGLLELREFIVSSSIDWQTFVYYISGIIIIYLSTAFNATAGTRIPLCLLYFTSLLLDVYVLKWNIKNQVRSTFVLLSLGIYVVGNIYNNRVKKKKKDRGYLLLDRYIRDTEDRSVKIESLVLTQTSVLQSLSDRILQLETLCNSKLEKTTVRGVNKKPTNKS